MVIPTGVNFFIFPGDHQIIVNMNGSPVSGSPFVCKVYDVSQIKVRDIPKGIVGKPVTFLGKFAFITLNISILFFVFKLFEAYQNLTEFPQQTYCTLPENRFWARHFSIVLKNMISVYSFLLDVSTTFATVILPWTRHLFQRQHYKVVSTFFQYWGCLLYKMEGIVEIDTRSKAHFSTYFLSIVFGGFSQQDWIRSNAIIIIIYICIAFDTKRVVRLGSA